MDRKATVGLPRVDMHLIERHKGKLVLIINNSHTSPILGKVVSVTGKDVTMEDPVLLQPRNNIHESPLTVPLKSNWSMTQHYTAVYAGRDIPEALYALNAENPVAHWETFARELSKGADYRTWKNGIGISSST